MTARASILVADDHPVVRDGLVSAIAAQPDMSVQGEAGVAAEVFAAVERKRPDVLLMDLMLGRQDGLALVKNLLGPWPDLRILVISMQEESLYAPRCWQAGAMGFVSKLEPTGEILAALRNILRGRPHFPPGVLAAARSRDGGASLEQLTDRELHVLQLIGAGLKPGEIAERMNISPRTVDTHRENIKRKLGATSSAQLIRLAVAGQGGIEKFD